MIEDLVGRMTRIDERATVEAVFGEAVHEDGRTIIPVAKVTYGFGFGGGRDAKKGPEEERPREGGGGGVSVRPVAILEMDSKASRVTPIIDLNRLALVGTLLVAWNVFWVTLTIRAIKKRGG